MQALSVRGGAEATLEGSRPQEDAVWGIHLELGVPPPPPAFLHLPSRASPQQAQARQPLHVHDCRVSTWQACVPQLLLDAAARIVRTGNANTPFASIGRVLFQLRT